MKNFELDEKELEKVFGGMLTEEAEAWVERNRENVIKRAGFLGGLADYALNAAREAAEIYDVADLKEAIEEYGIKVDDLD